MSKKNPPDSNSEGTRVDLGDDLLESTQFVNRSVEKQGKASEVSDLADQMQSARILLSEGILEEAKRVLRKILISFNGNLEARQLLEQIQEIEIRQIRDGSDLQRRRLGRREPETSIEVSADVVLKDLDRDLNLGILEQEQAQGVGALSLFEDRRALDEFGKKLDSEMVSSSVSDRVDLGIAFLEMGLYDLAIRIFDAVMQRLILEPEETAYQLISVTGLLSYTYILAGRAFDATMLMQPILAESEVQPVDKLDLIYLMARAYEVLGQTAAAQDWYMQTQQIDPHYRDVQDRLRDLGLKR